MLLDGLPERARDRLADQVEAFADERAEEIDWLVEVLPARTGESVATVRRILTERDAVIAEAESAEGKQP